MRSETYQDNQFAQNIYDQVANINFGNDIETIPIVSAELARKIKESPVGLDFRAKPEAENGYASVCEGLAFDPYRLRSQSFALYDSEKGNPVGIMTTIIAPKTWAESQRYFQRIDDGAQIVDFSAISSGNLPDFVIIPAWTKVIPEHLGHFAIPGFKAFRLIMKFLQDAAPENTWVEARAQGDWPVARKNELEQLTDRGVSQFIPRVDLPFDLDMIGRSSKGALPTVKMATIIDLQPVDGIGSGVSLGPTFVKRVH